MHLKHQKLFHVKSEKKNNEVAKWSKLKMLQIL